MLPRTVLLVTIAVDAFTRRANRERPHNYEGGRMPCNNVGYGEIILHSTAIPRTENFQALTAGQNNPKVPK